MGLKNTSTERTMNFQPVFSTSDKWSHLAMSRDATHLFVLVVLGSLGLQSFVILVIGAVQRERQTRCA